MKFHSSCLFLATCLLRWPITLLAMSGGASAAIVTWSSPKNITGASDVSTEGTYWGSWAPYNTNANQTPVNGVTFQGIDDLGGVTTSLNEGGKYFTSHTTSDSNYNSLLDYGAYASGPGGTFIINGGGSKPLVIGAVYQIQIWISDPRNLGSGVRTASLLGWGGYTSAPLTYPSNGTGMGQYILGTFTADNAIQLFGFDANVSAQVNLVQLRVVPEPSGILLGGLCFAGALMRRRR